MVPNKTQAMARIWRAKLEKLCRLRWGHNYLPDNASGRAMLTALLSVGLTDESAAEDASWCVPELPALKRQAQRIKWRDIGALIGLTFPEWEAAKLWIMRPIDKSEAELDAWRKERRKTQDSARKKLKREQERNERAKISAADKRCDAVLRMLEAGDRAFHRKPGANPPRFHGEWTPVSTLTELAARSRAFRRPDGRPVGGLRKAIHRTINELANGGLVETQLEPG